MDDIAWRRLLAKFEAAIARLARMRKPSLDEFMLVSEALLGGTAGYYGQTVVITKKSAEEVEAKWRAVFNKKFRRLRSTPRVELYMDGGGRAAGQQGRGRTHLVAHGQTAMATALGKAAADPVDTHQRAAARSAIAMSLYRWGCRGDPRKWAGHHRQHLLPALEASLDASRIKPMGDGWLWAYFGGAVGAAGQRG